MNAEDSVQKSEQIQVKYEAVLIENKHISEEKNAMKLRNSELLELCREWEHKYERKIDELCFKFERELKEKDTAYESNEK